MFSKWEIKRKDIYTEKKWYQWLKQIILYFLVFSYASSSRDFLSQLQLWTRVALRLSSLLGDFLGLLRDFTINLFPSLPRLMSFCVCFQTRLWGGGIGTRLGKLIKVVCKKHSSTKLLDTFFLQWVSMSFSQKFEVLKAYLGNLFWKHVFRMFQYKWFVFNNFEQSEWSN